MKFLVFTALCVCICQTIAVSTEVKTKMSPKGNVIPGPQKTELYYPQTNQQTQTEFMPVHVMQKPLFLQQAQPQPAMLIIAQPAYVPHNVIYGNAAGMQQQQLLNYFHGNPQAKYQLLFGGGFQPHPTAQPYVPQHPVPQATIPAYQIVANPVFSGFNHLVGAPSQMNYQQIQQPYQQNQVATQYVQPMQLNQLAHLAQMTAQHFTGGQQYNAGQQFTAGQQFAGGQQQLTAPIRSVPPIITGLENFTPEQQAQIKAQLGAHLGGHITAPISTATTAPATTSQYTSPLTTQTSQGMNSHDYMQNNDKNAPQGSATSFTPSLVYRAQYTKG